MHGERRSRHRGTHGQLFHEDMEGACMQGRVDLCWEAYENPLFPSAGASVEGNKASHDYWCGTAWHGSHGDQLHLDELTR